MHEHIDLLINARWIIPVEPACTVLERHALAVRDGCIVALEPQKTALERFKARETIDLAEHILFPGLVNLHVHAPMNLLRGIADDLPLMRWLQEAIWPAEGKHVSPAFVRDGTLLAAAEMLRGGITTCNEMYFYPDVAAEVFEKMGMRALIGCPVVEFATAYGTGANDYLRKAISTHDRWQNNPLIRVAIAPHAPYTVSDRSFERIASLAAELDSTIHIHLHETAQEIIDSHKHFGKRPLARLEKLGVLGPNTIAVHAVHLNDNDIAMLARHNCNVAHCPSSNMKLASGIAPIVHLLDMGINIGLGTDGAASNNRLDLFTEMRQAALLAKVSAFDASALPAHTVLNMATLGGAQALGMADKIGSLQAGKQADLCAIALNDIDLLPCFNPIAHLVYVAGRHHVSHVWVDGVMRVNDKALLLQMNNKELLSLAAMWQTKLKS